MIIAVVVDVVVVVVVVFSFRRKIRHLKIFKCIASTLSQLLDITTRLILSSVFAVSVAVSIVRSALRPCIDAVCACVCSTYIQYANKSIELYDNVYTHYNYSDQEHKISFFRRNISRRNQVISLTSPTDIENA